MLVKTDKKVAPIVLFVFARPDHTRRTLAALAANTLADQSDLIVYSDAARNTEEIERVNAVRTLTRNVTGFRTLKVIERNSNYGLARNIIEGVTAACEQYGRVIVLEDDLETSPYFLKFMNEALDFYENTSEVMHISGCRYPVEPFGTDDTFFLHVPLCWGWATWQRAWVTFEKNIDVMDRFDHSMIKSFNFENSYSYWNQLESNKSGQINSWFIFWYANLFLRGGLSLFPSCSLVNNIGFDNSGIHCHATSDYDGAIGMRHITLTKISPFISQEGYRKHVEFFRSLRPTLLSRIRFRLKMIYLLLGVNK